MFGGKRQTSEDRNGAGKSAGRLLFMGRQHPFRRGADSETDRGTLFEIKPVKAYPVDYGACVEQAKRECRDEFEPELATKVDDFSKYDVIFVGTPNWWSTMAPPVRSFLSSYDFSGKTVIPFVTHGGGGMARCERDMRKVCPKAVFGKGGAFSGGSIRNAADALSKWVNEVVVIRK
ncbi:MAG: NAD(P)H-dependent oxidoreductase [Lentisphaeria bacterium]|nr:MAG: NAD(P)H-dependent oxidoreductase [Lentisphaeria bacterium]